MFILLIMGLVLIYSLSIEQMNGRISFYLLIPIIVTLSFVTGFQYKVGTDYEMYYSVFSNSEKLEYFFRTKEYLFYYLIFFLRELNIEGQGVFVIISLIQNIILFLGLKKYNKEKILKNYTIYIFLYFTLIGSFFMQMNLIRQYIAIYLIFLSYAFLINKKYFQYLILILIAIFIHKSSAVGLILIIFQKIFNKKYKRQCYMVLILIAIILGTTEIAREIFKFSLRYIPGYEHYLYTKYTTQDPKLLSKLSKIIFVPLYLFSLYVIPKLTKNETLLFNIGFFSYALRIAMLFNDLTARLSDYFILFSIFPVYFYLVYTNSNINKKIVITGLCLIIVIKLVIIPFGEFKYSSYLISRI